MRSISARSRRSKRAAMASSSAGRAAAGRRGVALPGLRGRQLDEALVFEVAERRDDAQALPRRARAATWSGASITGPCFPAPMTRRRNAAARRGEAVEEVGDDRRRRVRAAEIPSQRRTACPGAGGPPARRYVANVLSTSGRTSEALGEASVTPATTSSSPGARASSSSSRAASASRLALSHRRSSRAWARRRGQASSSQTDGSPFPPGAADLLR